MREIPRAARPSGLNNDQIALVLVGAVLLGVAFARRGQVLAAASAWLQQHGLLTSSGEGLVQVPQLGGLDAPRLLLLVGLLLTIAVLIRIVSRARRARLQQQ